MPSFQITDDAAVSLHKRISDAVADPVNDIPGAVVCVVNQDGDYIFHGAAGSSKFAEAEADQEAMTVDRIFWLASCTKMITGIACMQLVEKGLLRLDDGDQAESLCPELKDLEVMEEGENGQVELVPKKGQITLRMLLTHTAGFGYGFWSPKLSDWLSARNIKIMDDMTQPMVNHPGEAWNYGIGIDWAARLLERVTGERLYDYMQKNILQPLGIKEIDMFPSEEMKDKLAGMHYRSGEDGTVASGPHLFVRAFIPEGEERDKIKENGGGGGLFSSTAEYCDIIATLLNGGTSPKTGAQILQPSTVDQMFENQIPEHPNFSRKGFPHAIPFLSNGLEELYPTQPHDQPQGWGLTFMLTVEPSPSGRGPNTASWAGLANCYWWADRHHGVGGIIASQVLPFADPKAISLAFDVEKIVYSGQKKQ